MLFVAWGDPVCGGSSRVRCCCALERGLRVGGVGASCVYVTVGRGSVSGGVVTVGVARPVEFAGVRKTKGSCVCIGAVTFPIQGPRRLTVELDTPRAKVNSSKLILVNSSGVTSFDVHVFGTSNSRTVVYKGTSHYVNGCMCSGELAGGGGVALRALSNVGRLRLAAQGLSNPRRRMARIAISVNYPMVNRATLRVRTKSCFCAKAIVSVKGPRLIVFIRSVAGVGLPIVKPLLRYRPLFPGQAGIRFIRTLDASRMQVGI